MPSSHLSVLGWQGGHGSIRANCSSDCCLSACGDLGGSGPSNCTESRMSNSDKTLVGAIVDIGGVIAARLASDYANTTSNLLVLLVLRRK